MSKEDSAIDMSNMTISDPLLKPVPFGRPMRDTHFLFDPSYISLNHGSFGTYPRYVQKRFRQCQDLAEARPDVAMLYQFPKLLHESRAAIADFLGLPVDEIVLVPNATVATNTVLRNLKFEEGDVILHLSTVYGAVEKTIESLKETTPVENINISITYPLSDDKLVEAFGQAIKSANGSGKKVRIAVFDTISSMPGVCGPWERLAALCKEEGVLSMVDAAHGVGHIKLHIADAQPDFLVSNLHKWLFVPRGCAVFYVPKRNQHMIRTTLPTSHGFRPLVRPGQPQISNPLPNSTKSEFVQLFEYVATIDMSPYLCIPAALEFRQHACGGENRIMQYCHGIANEAGKQAARIFGTELLDNEAGTLTKCALVQVKLPLRFGNGEGEVPSGDAMIVKGWLTKCLVEDYDTFAPIFFHGDALWVRFSGQIYVELDDYERGAKAIKELCEKVRGGAYLQDA